jgi:hypothetical protein
MHSFPQYRKYSNGTTYFKIESEKRFIEVSFIGKKPFIIEINATQYPEFLRIMDMLDCKEGIWEVLDQSEFENVVRPINLSSPE